MKQIESKLNILKSNYQGKQNFEGNQLKKILDNLILVEEIVPQEFNDFVDTFKALREIKLSMFGNNLSYCSPRPNPYFRNVVQNFENKWTNLQEKYRITAPPKVHIICEHIPEYIESKGMALGRTSDQLIEQTHQHTNKLFTKSKYYVKDLNSPAHMKKLRQGVNHYNTYNIWLLGMK